MKPREIIFHNRSNRKTLLCLGMVFLLVVTIFIPCKVKAAVDDFVITNGVLTEYNGSAKEVVIPDGVTRIEDSVFSDHTDFKMITIPNSVTSIGDYAFENCVNLTKIVIPNAVTSIGEYAFRKCVNLTKIVIPNSVTSIEHSTFEKCYRLSNVTISSSVTTIGFFAFKKCTSLKSIKIPNSVTSIGFGAFCECSKLSSITIPSSVNKIDGFAFDATPWLKEKQKKSPMIIINDILIDGIGSKNTVTIPEGVTSIGPNAFFCNDKITKVNLPESLEYIGDNAFGGCTELTTVKLPKSLKSIGSEAFIFCVKLKDIKFPNTLTKIGSCAFEYCKSLSNISVPNSVTTIGYAAFTNTAWIKYKAKKSPLVIVNNIVIDGGGCSGDVVIPNYVTTIGEKAFSTISMGLINEDFDEHRVINVTSVTIPASVKRIDDNAFEGCKMLSSVKIEGSDVSIGNEAFYNCEGLKDITFPSTMKSIGTDAFESTAWLRFEREKNPLVIVGNILIEGEVCSGKVVIPDSINAIVNHAFIMNFKLTDITIPSSVTSIGDFVFYDNNNLIISGNEGSYAQKYAKEHKITFKVIPEE